MNKDPNMVLPDERAQMERVYRAWDTAIAAGDISSLVNLYAPDAEIESPLIYEFTASKTGVLRGREAFRALYQEVARQQSNVIRPKHHDDYLVRGHRIIWEYARVTQSGDQSEFVESWDFNDRYEIRCHRVYWGWSRIANLSRKGFGARPERGA
ncbi:SnoaL-like domain-containing protein [Enhydrobacter aerosaccus]|uniref:SnoaL-like domain-containing protein n=1 Tax=Enhydrobacter aerosaccus TaxID=225324 RepID=A0A1T4SRS8_9HYPH|nr:nuclear transport factor 2 family protein [Enhydrobacter aerosaccus]SKA30852.1 SnoaL-like domain-containing protein [Enhydrobacter aerosaccus]